MNRTIYFLLFALLANNVHSQELATTVNELAEPFRFWQFEVDRMDSTWDEIAYSASGLPSSSANYCFIPILYEFSNDNLPFTIYFQQKPENNYDEFLKIFNENHKLLWQTYTCGGGGSFEDVFDLTNDTTSIIADANIFESDDKSDTSDNSQQLSSIADTQDNEVNKKYYFEKSIQNNNFIIYPNPVIDNLNFIDRNNEIKKMRIVDIHGKEIYFEINNTGTSSIDVSKICSGTYLLILETEKALVTTRLIKK